MESGSLDCKCHTDVIVLVMAYLAVFKAVDVNKNMLKFISVEVKRPWKFLIG